MICPAIPHIGQLLSSSRFTYFSPGHMASSSASEAVLAHPDGQEAGYSNRERMLSVEEAFATWREHPLLGAGLGTFVESHAGLLGQPLVIHNSALWVLAEMGVVGFAAFSGFAVACVRVLARRGGQNDALRVAGLLTLAGFAVMATFHDLAFQRPLWLILGMALAEVPATAKPQSGLGRSGPGEFPCRDRPGRLSWWGIGRIAGNINCTGPTVLIMRSRYRCHPDRATRAEGSFTRKRLKDPSATLGMTAK